MVLSKSQTELRSVKYDNPAKMKCTEVWKMAAIKISAVSMAVIFYGYISGKMLYFSLIMTTAGRNDVMMEFQESLIFA